VNNHLLKKGLSKRLQPSCGFQKSVYIFGRGARLDRMGRGQYLSAAFAQYPN
jgi:hypothetical protein